jgi:hypothetical protein
MPLGVESLEFFSGFVKLDLGCLSFSHFLLKLLSFSSNFDGKLFDLECELLDLGLIRSSVLLKSEVILFLLSGGKCPLFKLLLIPVHLKLELVHLLVSLEDHVLDVVQTVLLVGDSVVELLDFILQTTGLSLGDLFHVLFGFDFLVLGVDQRLGVHELHLN